MLRNNPKPEGIRSRGRRPLLALGVLALVTPLALVSPPAYAADTVPADVVPADAVEAITAGTLLPDFQQQYLSAVNSDSIWADVSTLSRDIGPRVRGSAAEMDAINWVIEKFESFGLETEIEEFSLAAGSAGFADVVPSRATGEDASWQFLPASNGPVTAAAPVLAAVVDIGVEIVGLAERTEELAGKVVLANWPAAPNVRAELLRDVAQAGAAALLLLSGGLVLAARRIRSQRLRAHA